MERSNKTVPIFELEKLPSDIIVKEQAIEIGKLKSYIFELEDENKDLKQRLTIAPKRAHVEQLEQQIVGLKRKLEESRESYRRLEISNNLTAKLHDNQTRNQQ